MISRSFFIAASPMSGAALSPRGATSAENPPLSQEDRKSCPRSLSDQCDETLMPTAKAVKTMHCSKVLFCTNKKGAEAPFAPTACQCCLSVLNGGLDGT